ncbi:M48 family metallopeptidase [Sulfurimonas sp. SAG-AH-194-L11]|nr:SprT family zinc-dependent metalloprotease [Sulfurimonas sp. SAG-AH-194-L11]MDF1876914.1 M48 family metallopeptidase [Sulfurimonas sp. SAG-AH-194-L11]
MSKLVYKGCDVELKYNPKLKNTYIGVESDKKILVKTSNNSYTYILNLLELRDSWIQKQLKKQKNYLSLEMNLEDEILLFSQKYSIDSEEATLLRTKLHKLRISSPQKIMKCYDDFYKSIATNYLQERAVHYAKVMNLSFKTIKYRKMKSRWGSCSSLKIITFNTELMKLKKHLIDYVVVHELAHLKHMNHSKDFHAFVDMYLPYSKELRRELKYIKLR